MYPAWRAGPARVVYVVGLAQTVVTAEDGQLAPDFEPGARVVFHAPGGAAVTAAVAQADISHWRAPRPLLARVRQPRRRIMFCAADWPRTSHC